MAYTTYATVKEYLNIPAGETADDALLTALIARAQATIDALAGRTFEAAGDTARAFDSSRDVSGPTLHLDADLAQITSVVNGDGVTVGASERTTEPRNSTPYHAITLLASSNKLWLAKPNGDPQNAISVSGRWAYSVSPPADVVQATIMLTAWLYHRRDNQDEAAERALVSPSGVVLVPGGLPKTLLALLAPYVKVGPK